MKNFKKFNDFVNESLNEKKFDHVKNAKIVYDVWDKVVGDDRKGIQLKHIDNGGKEQSQFVFTRIEGVRTPDRDLDKFAKEVEKELKKKGLEYDVNRSLGIVDIFESHYIHFINEVHKEWKQEREYIKQMADNNTSSVYKMADYVQFLGLLTDKQWEMFMYGRYKKDLRKTDPKTKNKIYKVFQKMFESVNESKHSYDKELEDARMMRGSAADLTNWAQRKIEESKPANETIILPINELGFNDLNGNPSKISKEIAKIIEKALPSNVLKKIGELEPNYIETMASPHDKSKKGVGTGFVEYKAIGVIMDNPKPGKLSGFTVGIRKRTSGPGTGYIAIRGSIRKGNMSYDQQLDLASGGGDYKNNYSVATEFWMGDSHAAEKLGELFKTYLAKYI